MYDNVPCTCTRTAVHWISTCVPTTCSNTVAVMFLLYISYLVIYTRIRRFYTWMCTRTSYDTYESDVLSFLFVSYKPSVGSGWRKTCLKKTEYILNNTSPLTRRTRINVEKRNNRLWCWPEYRTFPYISGQGGIWCKKSSYESSARPFVVLNSRCSSMTMTRESDRTSTLRGKKCSNPPILSQRCHAALACMLVS